MSEEDFLVIVKGGETDLIDAYVRSKPQPWNYHKNPLVVATKYLHTNIILSLLAHGFDINQEDSELGSCLSVTARGGNLDLMLFLLQQGATPNHGALMAALSSGHVRIFAHLVQLVPPAPEDWLSEAVDLGKVEIVQYLLAFKPDMQLEEALCCACAKGNLAIVKILVPDSPHFNLSNACLCAARAGHLSVVKYLVQQAGVNPTELEPSLAVSVATNHQDLVDYLVSLGVRQP
eukprot:TRINITY_DN1946_c0_g1_i4.p1 TRINITY_DN1946_c0_g1~~TRINITY_DN1946_c0_g1_i4.p1  ORF type:complete len:274 (+),score=68.01 TRINITY_DN1946_c0_g1_i4:126-824(+)